MRVIYLAVVLSFQIDIVSRSDVPLKDLHSVQDEKELLGAVQLRIALGTLHTHVFCMIAFSTGKRSLAMGLGELAQRARHNNRFSERRS